MWSASRDLQQLGIEGDDGVHNDVASNDNGDGEVPNHEKKVCCIHMFSIQTIFHSSIEFFGKRVICPSLDP